MIQEVKDFHIDSLHVLLRGLGPLSLGILRRWVPQVRLTRKSSQSCVGYYVSHVNSTYTKPWRQVGGKSFSGLSQAPPPGGGDTSTLPRWWLATKGCEILL